MKGKKHVPLLCLFFIICVASGFLTVDFGRLQMLPRGQILEENCVTSADFTDAAGLVDEGENTLFFPGDPGLRIFTADISLLSGDYLSVKFQADNHSGGPAVLVIDLYGEGFDNPYNEVQVALNPGVNRISRVINYRGYNEPESCQLRLFIWDAAEVQITGLKIDRMIWVQDNKNPARVGHMVFMILTGLSAAAFVITLIFMIRSRRGTERNPDGEKKSGWREALLYLVLFVLISGVLVLLYRNVNISYPMVYSGGDEMGIYYLAKTIRENGTTIITPMEAGASVGDMMDYPYSDKLSFVLVKVISLFTDNPYLTINLFYFLCFHLIGAFALFACRKLKLDRIPALLAALLYAFTPYIQMRYAHIWLVPFFMIPLACLMGVWIIEGKFLHEDTGCMNRPLIWKYMIPAFFCAFTGLYYAFFSCAIFAVAMVIRMLIVRKKGMLLHEIYPCLFIAAAIAGVLTNVLPNMVYWMMNGTNPGSELVLRSVSDAETYALKMTQLLLPRSGHRIGRLALLANKYSSYYPLVNENSTASLGLIGSVGFVISLFRLLMRKKEDHAVSALNLSAFLIGTIGGLGGLISVFVNIPMRCYNRISVVIMFLSLVTAMSLLGKLKTKISRPLYIPLCVLLACGGIFDQTVTNGKIDYSAYESNRDFINLIEEKLETGDRVYELPYDNWPSPLVRGSYILHTGYTESEGIDWSYGSMQGRSEACWQEYVSGLGAKEMVETLKQSSYNGLYLDRILCERKDGEEITLQRIRDLTDAIGTEPIISEDGRLYFWVL